MAAPIALVAVGLAATNVGCAAETSDPAPDQAATADADGPGWLTSERRPDSAPGRRAVPAPSQVTPEPPVALVLPDGTRMPVVPVGTQRDGALELPRDVGTAGWWEGGPRLGDPFGALVVAAHVDSFDDGLGPFAQLLTMRDGQRIRLFSPTLSQEFAVDSTRFVHRTSLPSDPDAFASNGPLRLVLITCGGPYDTEAGGYRDNVVVVAGLSTRPR